MNQFIFETLNYIFRALFGEDYLFPLLHFMISLENRELYMDYIYKWNFYLNLSGHYIFKKRFGTSPEKHCLTAIDIK